jgi:hypothetical protein
METFNAESSGLTSVRGGGTDFASGNEKVQTKEIPPLVLLSENRKKLLQAAPLWQLLIDWSSLGRVGLALGRLEENTD